MTNLSRYKNFSPGKHGLPHMGEVFTRYRIEAGWTSQEEFAKVCGVEPKAVIYWENQAYLTDMDRRIALCKILKIPPQYLGLTWRSLVDDESLPHYAHSLEYMAELLAENAYGLYEDILDAAHTSPHKYSPTSTYRYYKHQRELETLAKEACGPEKDSLQELVGRFYQHSAFVAQHHKEDELARFYMDQAVDIALPLKDVNLIGSALYRRSRIHLTQGRHGKAKEDIQAAMGYIKQMCGGVKGGIYLLSSEINAFYTENDKKLQKQCREWQKQAAELVYRGKIEDHGTFMAFSLYAVHHERAKMLARFALFHTNDQELLERLKNTHVRANSELVEEALSSLTAARKHMGLNQINAMEVSITEARIDLIQRQFEESAKVAKKALQIAREVHSKRGIGEVFQVYQMLKELAPQNPYICNLGIELGIY